MTSSGPPAVARRGPVRSAQWMPRVADRKCVLEKVRTVHPVAMDLCRHSAVDANNALSSQNKISRKTSPSHSEDQANMVIGKRAGRRLAKAPLFRFALAATKKKSNMASSLGVEPSGGRRISD